MNKIKKLWMLGIVLICSSCNSWLDVAPEDRIMEKDLFNSREGFLMALNGIYVEMNSASAYGASLSTTVVDVMGQYYQCTGDHGYAVYAAYTYGNASAKNGFESVWQKAYSQISNVNVILEHCETDREVLPGVYYNLIKGEALALRAMFHLDLLRLFGPLWSDKDKESIPYVTFSDRRVEPLLTADSVMVCVLADLGNARELLKEVDPVITQGALNYSGGENGNDLFYRQYRLNYYAVSALMARAYLWKQDYAMAKSIAEEVIGAVNDPENPLFPLCNIAYTQSSPKDRVFQTEVLFALYNSARTDNVYKRVYSSDLSALSILTLAGNYQSGRLNNLYDDHNDWRYKMWQSLTKDNKEICYFVKYAGVTANNEAEQLINDRFENMIPLIRISELYLIAAECEGCIENHVDIALKKYLNKVRLARGCVDVEVATVADLRKAITDEYIREFIGEGQTFFYFKRNEMQNIPDGSLENGTMNMQLTNYVVPLPDSEISQRD